MIFYDFLTARLKFHGLFLLLSQSVAPKQHGSVVIMNLERHRINRNYNESL